MGFWLPDGIYSHGMHDLIIDELELGFRVALWLDEENNQGWTPLDDISYQQHLGAEIARDR